MLDERRRTSAVTSCCRYAVWLNTVPIVRLVRGPTPLFWYITTCSSTARMLARRKDPTGPVSIGVLEG